MTDTTDHVYGGDMAAGFLALPTRSVPFTKGEPVALTSDEVALLGPEWKPAKTRKTSAPADTTAYPATEQEA